MKQKLFTLFMLLVAVTTGAWAQEADPDYESYDWSSADAMAEGLAGNSAVSISVVNGGSDGNVSGHYYKPLNSAIDGSKNPMGTYLSVSSSQQIEKVAVFYCPNGTSTTSLAWAVWGKNVTPNAEVGTNYGKTAGVKSSKSWDSAIWETIDFSDIEAYTVYISRQLKNLTNNGTKISNTGDNQTVNVLGIRVWLKASAPTISTQPQSAAYSTGQTIAALTVEASGTGTLTYQWYKNTTNEAVVDTDHAIDGATSDTYTPTEAGFYYVVVTDANGSVTSDVAEITISAAEAPTISVSGAPTGDVIVGTEVILTAEATGVPTPTITWYDGSDAEVGTGETYTVPTDVAGTFTFYAKASNSAGDATSATQTIVVKEQVATPTLPASGVFTTGSKIVEIACATEGATILYSTDGGATWNTYTEALTITEATTVQAKATLTGYIDSEIASATYSPFSPAEIEAVSTATTWDWTSWNQTLELKNDGTTSPSSTDEYTFNDIATISGKITVPSGFNGAAMMFKGQYPVRGKKSQAGTWTIKTTVPGTLAISFSDTGSSISTGTTPAKRYLNVNGVNTQYYTQRTGSSSDAKTVTVYVPKGDVVITSYDDNNTWQAIVVTKIVFTPYDGIVLDETGSNAATVASAAGTTTNVHVSRTLSPDYYNTLYLPFAMSAEQMTTAFGDGAQVATFTGEIKNETSFQFANVTAMEAYTGYLVKPAATVNGFTVEGATISSTVPSVETDWAMIGTLDNFANSTENGDIYYFTTSGTVKKLSATGNIKGLRAFMCNKETATSIITSISSNAGLTFGGGSTEPARADEFVFYISIDGDDDVTAINAIDGVPVLDANAPVYNLAGQRVGQSYKGVVIQNGKKFVIK